MHVFLFPRRPTRCLQGPLLPPRRQTRRRSQGIRSLLGPSAPTLRQRHTSHFKAFTSTGVVSSVPLVSCFSIPLGMMPRTFPSLILRVAMAMASMAACTSLCVYSSLGGAYPETYSHTNEKASGQYNTSNYGHTDAPIPADTCTLEEESPRG